MRVRTSVKHGYKSPGNKNYGKMLSKNTFSMTALNMINKENYMNNINQNQSRDIYSPEQKKYSVYLPKYGITVQTALTDAREIMFSTEISALKQSRDLYFALGRMGESRKDYTDGFFKQAVKGIGASAVNMAGNLYGAAVNAGWKSLNAAALQWARSNKAAEVSTPEELDFASKIDKEKYAAAERAREEWTKRQRADLADFMQKTGLDKTQFDGFVYDLLSGGTTAVSALAVGAITKSPAAVAAMFGAVSGQDYYGEALESGLKGDKALLAGFGAGSLEGLLELWGTEQLFKAMAGAKSFKLPIRAVMRYARKKGVYGVALSSAQGAVSEGAEEFTQNIASSAVMNAMDARNDTYDEIIAESFYGAVLGAITGAGMAGAGRAAALAASKLKKAGMPEEAAQDIASKIIQQAYEKESIEEAVKLAESENSPLTYENSDKAAAAQKFAGQVRDFASPQRRAQAAKEVWNIKDAVTDEALKAGLSEQEAAMAARAYQSAANMFYENTGVMPKDWWEQYRLEIKNNMQKRAGGNGNDTFYQAAMYKSRAKNLVEFRENAKKNRKNNKRQFYSIKGQYDIDVAQDAIINNENKKLLDEELAAIEISFKNPDINNYEILEGNGSYNGISVLLNINTIKGNLNALIEITENERIFLTEAKFEEDNKKIAIRPVSDFNTVSYGLKYSLSDIVDIVNSEFEKGIGEKAIAEIVNITNGLKERISARKSRTYDKDNFYRKTTGNFKTGKAPGRAPDYISASGSKYWIEKGGVYRQSDHWGKISTNEWTLDGKESVETEKTGYARWQDFGYNGAQDKARLAKYENVLKRKGVVATEGEENNRFNQAPAAGARGYVEFTGQGVFMRLLEEADPSTVVHEVCGHVLLRNMEDIKSLAETNGGASAEFARIWEDLEKWLGPAQRIEEDGKVKYRFSREQQEQFAEGMEKMFAAGKAPAVGFERIFAYFKRMLSDMYAEAREWLNLRPEVEDLFSRILAGAEEKAADSKTYKGRTADVKAVAARARKGEAASINGIGIKEVKALIKQLGRRRPPMPKDDLLTVLKRKGADYANAGRVDAEAYSNAGVKDKKGGVADKPALWLKEEGFMSEGGDEAAFALIERALNGEKIWRLEDMEKVSAIENFDANIEAIREAFGGNVQEAEETLRAIEDLQAKGYRVIGDADIEYAEAEAGRLLSRAERERQLKAEIDKLTRDKEELGNIAQRRLEDIHRRAALAREEGYKEAIKDAEDKKTVKDLLAIEREAQKNTLDMRRVKNALIKELEKRELSGKEQMLSGLKAAQSPEEINQAAKEFLGKLHKAYEESEAGQAQKRKTDLPDTDWGRVKLKALEAFRNIAQSAGAEISEARKLNKEAALLRTKGIKPDAEKQARIDNARDKTLKGWGLKYAKALRDAFKGIEHIDEVWLEKAALSLGREYAGRANIIGRPLDLLTERAQREQAKNYKKYIGAKIEAMISAGYKVKDGQKQKGKYDYATNKLFEDLAHIKNMDKTAAKAELARRRAIIAEAPSPAEAALKIAGLKGEAENMPADFIENMKLENAFLAYKGGKMSRVEMDMAKESLAEQGLPDNIGDDEWHYISPRLLSELYAELDARRKAAFEGRLSQSMELAEKAREEKEAFAKAVRQNKKAGIFTKGYLGLIANWESFLNAVASSGIKEKYSLLQEEARAEVRASEKMKEVINQVKNTLGVKDAAAVKKWFDALDEAAGIWQNRIESKRMAMQEAAPAVRESMEALEQFRRLTAGKNEVVLRDFLTFDDEHGQKKSHNLKIVFDGQDGGLKSIFDAQGNDGVMKAVHAALKGLKVKQEGGIIFLRVRNDFAAVLKHSSPGGKSTYTLIDYALFDEKGRQSAGYGIDGENKIKGDKFFQAAMYKTPHREFKSFYNAAQNAKGGKQSYYTYTTSDGINIDIPSDTILHDKKHPEMTAEEWIKGLGCIDDIEDSFYTKPRFSNGIGILLKVKGKGSKYGAEITLTPSGRVILNTMFRSTDEGINAWIQKEKENAGMSAPLRRGQASRSEDVISSRSPLYSLADILKNANSQKDTFFQGKKENIINTENAQKEAEVNSKETAFEVKKAALAAAQNALNPYMDGLYKPVAQKLTKGQIIDIYNIAKNPIGYVRLENQYGADQLTDMFAKLTPEDKQIADSWQKTVSSGYDEVNKVFIRQYGLDMGRPENYWPFKVERIESELDALMQNYREAHRPGMTKSRTAGQLVEMLPMNPVEKLYRHYSSAMQYVETSEKTGWLRRILRDSKIKKTVEEQFGPDAAKTMYELLDNSTLGAGKNSVKHYEDGIMNWLTNNYVKAAIAAKPSIALKQLISVINYSENMPAGEWAKGFMEGLANPKQTIAFMMQDPYLKTRWENGTQNEALMRALAQDFGKTKGVKALNSFSNILAINVRLGDIGAIIFGGKPYVDYLMKTKGMSREEAFKQFRLDTLRSQQASNRSALSRLQAKEMNWLMRALFAFKNTGNQYIRKMADAVIMYKRGEIDAKQLAKTIAIYGVINQYLYVAATSLGVLGAAYAGFDDEDKNREMLAEFMVWPAQNFGFLPILDDAVNQASYRLTNLALGGKSGALRNPEVPLIKDVYDAVRSLGKDDLTFEDWVNAAAPLAQTATGLPVKYFASAAKTPYELAEGNFTKTALILGGWTPKRAEKVSGD